LARSRLKSPLRPAKSYCILYVICEVLCSPYCLITGAYRTSEAEQRSAESALWNNHGPVMPRQDGRGLQTYTLSRIRTYARGLKLCGSAEIMCEIFSRY